MKMRKYYIILCLLIVELSVAGYITTNHPIITEKTMTKREYTKPELRVIDIDDDGAAPYSIEIDPVCVRLHKNIDDALEADVRDGYSHRYICTNCGRTYLPTVTASPSA